MPELYDNARQANSRFVPKFIGSERETLKDVADTLDARYRSNRDLSDRLAIQMANDRYHQADQHIGDELYNKFSGLIDEVASSDANFENSTGIISQAAREYGTNQDRIAALENAKRFEQYQAAKAELGAEAVDFTPEYKGVRNPDGTINRFRPDLQKKLDYDKQKEQYFNQIEADLTQKGYTQDEINKEFLRSAITGGISNTKINNYIDKAFTRYRGTAEYAQEKRVLEQRGIIGEDADKEIRKSLLATGLERVHNITKQDLQRHSEAYLKGIYTPSTDVPFTPSVPGAAKVNTVFTPLEDEQTILSDPSVFKNAGTGKYYRRVPIDIHGRELSKEQLDNSPGLLYSEKAVEFVPNKKGTVGTAEYQYDYLTNNMSERQKQLVKQRVGNKSWTAEDFAKDHAEFGKTAKQVVESGEQLTDNNTPIYQNYLRGAGLNAPTILEGETEPKTLKEILAGLDGEKIEVVPALLNRTSPNNKLGANIEGTIYVDGKPTKSFSTKLSDQFDAASTELDDIFKNSLYKGSDTYTKDKPKVSSQFFQAEGKTYTPVYYTTTVPVGGEYPFDTEIHVGVAEVQGTINGRPILGDISYPGESYTAAEFKAKQTEISRRKLQNVYASGQMTDTDLKAINP